jgi:hypothetical protein
MDINSNLRAGGRLLSTKASDFLSSARTAAATFAQSYVEMGKDVAGFVVGDKIKRGYLDPVAARTWKTISGKSYDKYFTTL